MNSFSTLGLNPAVVEALSGLGYASPTPIQIQAIPFALQGEDLVGCAQTGTGKTAAFCLPLLDKFLREAAGSPQQPMMTSGTPSSPSFKGERRQVGHQPAHHSPSREGAKALVLAPTREIACQIHLFWQKLTVRHRHLSAALVIGGASMSAQLRALKSAPALIVATPGRLVDHLRQRSVRLDQISYLVLDEADRMLDMGFAPQLHSIVQVLPKKRQTLFFTATWDSQLDKLTKTYLTDPQRVTVGAPSSTATKVDQSLIWTQSQKKNETLLDQLNEREGSILIFARTKSRTDRLSRLLTDYGHSVGRIHGDRSQAQRAAALKSFRSGKVRILVATDIAARGIDVSNIAHVINYDLPQSPEEYIHRIGRTGRAGASGEAISILVPEERQKWKEIQRLLQRSGSPLPRDLAPTSHSSSSQDKGDDDTPRPVALPPRPHRGHPRSQQRRERSSEGGHRRRF